MSHRTIRPLLVTLILALGVFVAAPVLAANSNASERGQERSSQAPRGTSTDHDGDADSSSSTAMTEDDDGDGVPNTPDPDGDADNMHPSGRDKHAEAGGSGNQGASESDPDGADNGGVDKPGGSGGDDIFDQDGNNGCGNDDDFEDDNRGNCGGLGSQIARATVTVSAAPDGGAVTLVPRRSPDRASAQGDAESIVRDQPETAVLGITVAAPAELAQGEARANPRPATVPFNDVGVVQDVGDADGGSVLPKVLALTGIALGLLLAVASTALGFGSALRRLVRRGA